MNRKIFFIALVLLVVGATIAVAQRSVIPRTPTLDRGVYLRGSSSTKYGSIEVADNVSGGGQIVKAYGADNELVDRGVIRFNGRNGSIAFDEGETYVVSWVDSKTFTSNDGEVTWKWARR